MTSTLSPSPADTATPREGSPARSAETPTADWPPSQNPAIHPDEPRAIDAEQFKLSDAQWRRIEPVLPIAAKPTDYRNTISAIVHVLRGYLEWSNCPAQY